MDDIDPIVFEWLKTFAGRLDIPPPTTEEIAAVLDLAGAAARSSARQAAPVACWLVARAGVSHADAMEASGPV